MYEVIFVIWIGLVVYKESVDIVWLIIGVLLEELFSGFIGDEE